MHCPGPGLSLEEDIGINSLRNRAESIHFCGTEMARKSKGTESLLEFLD